MTKRLALILPMIALGTAAWAESHATDAGADMATETGEMTLAVEDADFEAAEKIFKRSCRGCHGNKAQGASSYPALADKEPEYIAEMLKRYRDGERIGPNSILMIQQAKKLSDEDIVDISVYVATAFD